MIDVVILSIISAVLPIKTIYFDILPHSFESDFWQSLVNFEAVIISPLYFVGCRLWNKGQTPGKKIMKIKTVTVDGTGLSPLQSVIDCIGYYALPLDVILGSMFSARSQRLTQMCSGTVVIEE